ncbi:hypothetical protein FA10DRAFT_183067 [Acaromyces ingoldii]|uniref:P-loop containing nucleoside triphosphate hydrolase protein n=1 Tax=Acaromyces ingoldii TaxID=215250 RepID=A0A316YEL4_9BASI|nr:hypothetical protein FA10DRAFT_183067 [Acaromyces ingoldii]PWN87324.1 hypothetical protein FA10DRAFT_183067 [Acaromyces ingoldii]
MDAQGVGCSAVWQGLDWSPCFRQRFLNGAVPLAALAVSLAIVSIQQALSNRRHRESAVRVATLDPTSSSIVLPHENGLDGLGEEEDDDDEDNSAPPLVPLRRRPGMVERALTLIMPWNAPYIVAKLSAPSRQKKKRRGRRRRRQHTSSSSVIPADEAADKVVFHTENAVILNEVHTNMAKTLADDSLRASDAEVVKRVWEALGSIALAGTCVAQLAFDGPVYSSSSSSWAWLALWTYLSVLSTVCLCLRRSLFTHKALLFALATLVSLSNLRSSIVATNSSRTSIVFAAIECSLCLATLLPSLVFPLELRLPSRLRAIHQTIKAQKAYGEARTAIPTPRVRHSPSQTPSLDGAHAHEDMLAARLAAIDGAHTKASEKAASLLPSPENRAPLLSRALFSFVTPAMLKHYRIQFTLDAVPDLPPADQAACVVAAFRADGDAAAVGRAAPASQVSEDDDDDDDDDDDRDDEEEGRGRSEDGGQTGEHLAPSHRSLAVRLLIHFLPLVLLQQAWAVMEAVFNLTPAVGLRFVLGYIGDRSRDGTSTTPVHMAVLYATGMLVGQIIAATCTSQALLVGRRMCIRLKAILIFEIINKALRRRDTGGGTEASPENNDDASPQQQQQKDGHKGGNDGGKGEQQQGSLGGQQGGRASDGEVTNLVSVDVFKVSEVGAYLHFLFPSAPLQIVLCVYLLINLLGWSAVGGVAVLVLSLPLQTLISRLFVRLQRRLLEATDRRLNLTSEVLNCIKTVKFFAWEKSFEKRLDDARERELAVLYMRLGAWLLGAATYIGMAMVVSLVTFAVHVGVLHRPLPAEVAFTAMALFNALRHPLEALPDMLVNVLTSLVSIRRIDHYLQEAETEKYRQLLGGGGGGAGDGGPASATRMRQAATSDPVVGFRDATFTYAENDEAKVEDESPAPFQLKDLNLAFPLGKLSVVAGPVGCGKTTLLMSLLGETRRLRGTTFMPCAVARSLVDVDPRTGLSETVAYCSQSPWLLGATVRENILFGQPYDEARYRAVLHACALEADLAILEYHDETEVGEKGTSLSGGQKARLALARALYSPARYLLLDDALSAVDVHTAKHLFTHYLKGDLIRGRTVILVTHAVQLCLPGAAFAVALDDGRVVAAGTPAEVLATGVFDDDDAPVVSSSGNGNGNGNDSTKDNRGRRDSNGSPAEDAIKADGGDPSDEPPLIEELDEGARAAEQDAIKKRQDKKALYANEETYAKGSIGIKSYKLYLSNFSTSRLGLLAYWVIGIVVFVAARGMDVVATAWLRRWAGSYDDPQQQHHLQQERQESGAASLGLLHASSRVMGMATTLAVSVADDAQRWLSNSPAPVIQSSNQLVMGMDMGMGTGTNMGEQMLFEDRTRYYLTGYALLVVLFILIGVLRDAIGLYGALQASRSLYRQLMTTIMRARPQWFDRTPVGRIMNRLSKDIETLDQELAPQLIFFIDVCIQSTVILIVSCYAVPAFTVFSAVVIVLYYAIGALYVVSSRDLKRIESVTRSPIFTLVGEALSGAVVIRAYGDASRFTRHCLRLIDKTNRPFFFLWYENRWLSQRVDMLSSFVTFGMALILIYSKDVDAAKAGFVLSFTIQLVEAVLWVLRMYTNIEINANGIERIAEYLAVEPERHEGTDPPAAWPTKHGGLHVESLSVRYAPELPLVLRGVSFSVAPGEKVGICGRTGSGKSSLALALFRFLEAEQGRIVVDGIDIATVPLETLRNRLTVIPQDAQLFSGTVRSNLDPFGTCEDAELWNALQRCQLVNVSSAGSRACTRPSSPSGGGGGGGGGEEAGGTQAVTMTNVITSLEMAVEQGGKNFSAGQKQLLALARGLIKLRHSNVVVLDESTASLDAHSDAAIQRTIQDEMADATILTVAHRIRGIVGYDKVLVLDHGTVVEYGAPLELMLRSSEGSAFRDLCLRSGEFDALEEIAREAERKRREKAARPT